MEYDVDAAETDIKYSEAGMEVALRPSRIALAAIGAMALATVALALCTGGPVAARVLAATWALCLALEAVHRIAWLRGARGARRLVLGRTREIEVESERGICRGTVCDGCFVAPWLTIVRWRPAGARFDRALVVLPDMISPTQHRRLRVVLRWA